VRITSVITRSDVVGGASLHVADVAAGLLDRGHEVHVVVGGTGPFVDVLRERGVPLRTLPSLVRRPDPVADARAVRALRAELRRWRPDIVTAHTSKAGAVARLAAWSLGLPATYTPHDFAFGPAYPGLQGTVYSTVERVLARVPRTVVIDVSEEERQRALARRVGRPDRHVVIRNGIADVDTALQCGAAVDGPLRLLVVARHEPPKDHATLVRALARITALPWTCRLVGSGDGIEATRADVVAHGLAERVEVVGPSSDVAGEMARASVLVLPSRSESFPLCVLEAMRAGLPVVASDVGGVGEAVVDGSTGLLVPPGDADALARALRTLVVDPALRSELGARARRSYVTRFGLDAMLDALEATYAGLCGVALDQRAPHGDGVIDLRAGSPVARPRAGTTGPVVDAVTTGSPR
jgi:glycosyltransferase involved in cell wall biosynthesis